MSENEFGDRDIGIYYTAKGRKLAQISMILKDVPGAQSGVLKILASHGIDLKLGWFDTEERGVTGRYSAFVDITDSDAEMEQVAREIRETKMVPKVDIRKGKNVVFDGHFKGLRMFDRDVLPIGVSEWSKMKPHVNPKVLRNIGRTFGEVMAEYWLDAVGKLTSKLPVWEKILESRAIGDKVTIDVENGLVIIENCFSSREFRGEGPSCFAVSGMLEGILSHILMEDVKVREVECLANYQERCVFKIDNPSNEKLREFEKISEEMDGI